MHFARLLVALGVLSLAVGQEGAWDELTTRAQQLFAEGKYLAGEKPAREALRLAEASSPPDPVQLAVSLHNLAEFARALRHLTEAESLLTRAVAAASRAFGPEDPAVAAVLNSQATLARDRRQFSEAERLYRRALEIDRSALGGEDPAVARDLNNLASLLASRRPKDAEPLARQALDLTARLFPGQPLTAVALRNLATIRYLQGDSAEALDLQQQALTILETSLPAGHPDLAVARKELATVRASHAAGPEGQIARLEIVITARPRDLEARLRLGRLLDRQARYPEARAQFEKATRLDPNCREAWEYLALLYEFEQNFEQATSAYKRAIELERTLGPPSEMPYLNYGILLAKIQREPEAVVQLETALARSPGSAKVQFELGRVRLQMNQLEPARDALLQAVRLDPSLVRAHYFLGQVYQRLEQPDLASRSFARFKELEKKRGSTVR